MPAYDPGFIQRAAAHAPSTEETVAPSDGAISVDKEALRRGLRSEVAPLVNLDETAQKVHTALHDSIFGEDEAALVRIFSELKPEQARELVGIYERKYGGDLIKELHVGLDTGSADCNAVMRAFGEVDIDVVATSARISKSLENGDAEAVNKELSLLDPSKLNELKDSYKRFSGDSLEVALRANLEGADLDQALSRVTRQSPAELAKALHESFGLLNDDEARIFGIMERMEPTEFAEVAEAYKLLGGNLVDDLQYYLSADEYVTAMNKLDSSPAMKAAGDLYYAMKGMGTYNGIVEDVMKDKSPEQFREIETLFNQYFAGQGESLRTWLRGDMSETQLATTLGSLDANRDLLAEANQRTPQRTGIEIAAAKSVQGSPVTEAQMQLAEAPVAPVPSAAAAAQRETKIAGGAEAPVAPSVDTEPVQTLGASEDDVAIASQVPVPDTEAEEFADGAAAIEETEHEPSAGEEEGLGTATNLSQSAPVTAGAALSVDTHVTSLLEGIHFDPSVIQDQSLRKLAELYVAVANDPNDPLAMSGLTEFASDLTAEQQDQMLALVSQWVPFNEQQRELHIDFISLLKSPDTFDINTMQIGSGLEPADYEAQLAQYFPKSQVLDPFGVVPDSSVAASVVPAPAVEAEKEAVVATAAALETAGSRPSVETEEAETDAQIEAHIAKYRELLEQREAKLKEIAEIEAQLHEIAKPYRIEPKPNSKANTTVVKAA